MTDLISIFISLYSYNIVISGRPIAKYPSCLWMRSVPPRLGCLKVAAWAQFSCPRFGPRAHRPLSSLGTVLAGEVHAPPDASLLASIIGPINPPSPVTTGWDKRARDAPTVPTPTPPRAMDTSSHGAGRAPSLSAPRACTAQTRA